MSDLKSVETIVSRSNGFKPSVGIILGSGLGSFVDEIEDQIEFSYDELDGFPPAGVGGHEGKLVLGKIAETPVAVLQGRVHYYESGEVDERGGVG